MSCGEENYELWLVILYIDRAYHTVKVQDKAASRSKEKTSWISHKSGDGDSDSQKFRAFPVRLRLLVEFGFAKELNEIRKVNIC